MEWVSLTYAYAKKRAKIGQLFLGIGMGGRAYVGRLDSITDRYIELTNGPHREVVYYDQRPIKFTMVELPEDKMFRLRDSTLDLDVREAENSPL